MSLLAEPTEPQSNDNAPLAAIEAWLGQPLPPVYRTFLAALPDDLPIGDSVLLYGPPSLVERNETYETQQYCPGFLTIGDDGGGRQILLSLTTEQVSLVDAGSMNSDFAESLGATFAAWHTAGCPLPEDANDATH